jgi:hypothetical protein
MKKIFCGLYLEMSLLVIFPVYNTVLLFKLNLLLVKQIDDLTASFGSKKKKQAMGSRLRNEIRGEALEKALSSAVDDAISQNRNLSGRWS